MRNKKKTLRDSPNSTLESVKKNYKPILVSISSQKMARGTIPQVLISEDMLFGALFYFFIEAKSKLAFCYLRILWLEDKFYNDYLL